MGSWQGLRRRWRVFALCLGFNGCGFSVSGGAPPDVIAPDVSIDTLPPLAKRWAVVNVLRGTSVSSAFPFDETGIEAGCGEHVAPISRFLLGHPSLPYVYSASGTFEGIGVGCGGIVETSLGTFGGQRPNQRIVLNSSASVGFFSADGAGATGVYRFTVAGDGVPTAGGSTNGPVSSGALAIDEANSQLFIGGVNVVWRYGLVGGALDLPGAGTHTNAYGCGDPIDLLLSGNFILAFCGDRAEIQRFRRMPYGFDSTAGSLGSVDRVVALPGDRAIAALTDPPGLVVLELVQGSPTWGSAVPVLSRVTAMAASQDGEVVITARQVDAGTSELEAWRIVGNNVLPMGRRTIQGEVRSVAITQPGS